MCKFFYIIFLISIYFGYAQDTSACLNIYNECNLEFDKIIKDEKMKLERN